MLRVLGITRDWIVAELHEVLEQAKEEGKLAPANRALELLAKLRGDMIAHPLDHPFGLQQMMPSMCKMAGVSPLSTSIWE
jgi:hypothetical protein